MSRLCRKHATDVHVPRALCLQTSFPFYASHTYHFFLTSCERKSVIAPAANAQSCPPPSSCVDLDIDDVVKWLPFPSKQKLNKDGARTGRVTAVLQARAETSGENRPDTVLCSPTGCYTLCPSG